jgi:hypothetical protein
MKAEINRSPPQITPQGKNSLAHRSAIELSVEFLRVVGSFFGDCSMCY